MNFPTNRELLLKKSKKKNGQVTPRSVFYKLLLSM